MRTQAQHGFSLLELMIVITVGLIICGFAIPVYLQTMRNLRLSGDAVDINGELLTAKMRASANFTRYRIYFDLNARTWTPQSWDKVGHQWTNLTVGAPQYLATGNNYGVGDQTLTPTNTAIAQAPACRPGLATPAPDGNPGGGSDISNTACIVFNSRGFPVDNTGATVGTDAIYINNQDAVAGVTVSISGLSQTWRHDRGNTNYLKWVQR